MLDPGPATDEASARLTGAFADTPPLFELLRTVRNRRVAAGWSLNTDEHEAHPVTGRLMKQGKAALEHRATGPVRPVEELEEALLCWAACGPNGLAAWDWVFSGGFNQLVDLAGRTAPSPHNTRATDLFVINDAGVSLYRPSPQRSAVVELSGGGDRAHDDVLRWYRENRKTIRENRPDFDWAMWQENAPNAPMSGSANFHLNYPGGTWLLPISDNGRLMFTLLDLMATGHKYFVDDFDGDRPAGLGTWIRTGRLEQPLPISAFEQTVLQAETYAAGAMTQNARLAAEALGLGCWTVSGFNRDVLLGAYPHITEGLGFGWAAPNNSAPMASGRLKSFGLPGVLDATMVPSPRWPDGRSVVDAWYDERFGEGGWGDDGPGGLLRRGQGAWKPEVVGRILADPAVPYPDWVWDAAVAYIDYCVERHGQWPVTFNPIQTHWSAIVHHPDVAFYDKYYRDGLVTAAMRTHEGIGIDDASSRR